MKNDQGLQKDAFWGLTNGVLTLESTKAPQKWTIGKGYDPALLGAFVDGGFDVGGDLRWGALGAFSVVGRSLRPGS